jgi:5-methylcytosine-specific restriction enzyme subunit McrC
VAITDAKYRDLSGKSLPEKWLYQLAIYAMSYDRGIATILYPTTDLSAREVRIDVTDPIRGGNRAQVQLRPVLLDKLEGLVMAMPSAAVERERRAYAKQLIFGA